MAYKEVSSELPEFWENKNPEDFIEGIYISKKTNVGKNKSNVYVLEVSEGEKKCVWGSTVLDEKMEEIKVGDKIKITFLGKEKDKNYHNFKLEKDEDEE